MITKTIQITEVSVDELADKVADKLLLKIKSYLDDLSTKKNDVYLTRQETADFLKINATTLWNWTNKGKVISYGLGHRRYYNKQEIIDTLKKNQLLLK
ncbi:MAG: helix-turn-helix domain-containing protein [Winogradskyella sp.]|uniref:helix-turn-helix domain-containing protein n=1 Tax=Winogradskyella sp. TaxID=1883156 RepID=UPI0017E7A538|nr:helix-turn-helix domain-containing protein [Winogradskyella sp.]MBT8245571.1 helix-turn-helix domain-containing protein [Winogradskyella sp.]NNK22841.1 helix-turn-helix domain-containing protein [Winogradskyella sp.]